MSLPGCFFNILPLHPLLQAPVYYLLTIRQLAAHITDTRQAFLPYHIRIHLYNYPLQRKTEPQPTPLLPNNALDNA
jgi:hypothetical protein